MRFFAPHALQASSGAADLALQLHRRCSRPVNSMTAHEETGCAGLAGGAGLHTARMQQAAAAACAHEEAVLDYVCGREAGQSI